MDSNKVSTSFRKRLKLVIPFWLEQGFLTHQQGDQLSEFYHLEQIKTENTHLLLSVIYTIGSILIGVGVISFVAAHWNEIGRPMKVTMLFAAMLFAHGLGLYFWFINGNYPKLGHALILLGTLIFGANIGLMAQIFHISGGAGRMYGVWAIGAAAVAYAVRSIPNATVAVVMSFIFCMSYRDYFWGVHQPIFWYPFVAVIFLVPLVYLCNSRWLLWLVMINLAVTSPLVFGQFAEFTGAYMVTVALGAAFLAWGMINQENPRFPHFSGNCSNAGVIMILLFVYLLSFYDCAEEIKGRFLFKTNIASIFGCVFLLGCIGVYIFSVFRYYSKCRDIISVLLLGAGGLILGAQGMMGLPVLTQVLANILLAVIAANFIRASYCEEDRRKFWGGAVILGAIIIGRTLEFETDLLIKAIAFTGSGIGVIVGGVMFENFLKKRKVLHA